MWQGPIQWLADLGGNSSMFLLAFFIFALLAALVLPIPIELGLTVLVARDFSLYGMDIYGTAALLALTMGFGKMVGSILVFKIGARIESTMEYWNRWGGIRSIVNRMERLVARTKYVGLFVLLVIPLMTDTVPIYLWSIFNDKGAVLELHKFAITNFLAGVARALIVIALFVHYGIVAA